MSSALRIQSLLLLAAVIAPLATAQAKVDAKEAARLDTELTPVGAIKAANSAGTIPAWTGGLTTPPPAFKGLDTPGFRLVTPYPNDKPLFTITSANLAEHKDKLTVGHLAMFKAYPKTYQMPVYKTRRDVTYPDTIHKATRKNAETAEISGKTGDVIKGAIGGFPFPIPKNGLEVMWNHRLRYSGASGTRYNVFAVVRSDGETFISKKREEFTQPYYLPGATPESIKNVFAYFLQTTYFPPRQAGNVGLVHETMDAVAEPRRIWIYNRGQGRVRRAPEVGYDTPALGADGLLTNDQQDSFNGGFDRYTWKLLGKKELYVPYTAYKLHDEKYKYKDILKAGHLNTALTRYELHRVWVVDAEQPPGAPAHIYKRRTYYLDEDSWTILGADIYDKNNALWRVQENHTGAVYIKPQFLFTASTAECNYDLISRRYACINLNNEEPESFPRSFETSFFTTNNMKDAAERSE